MWNQVRVWFVDGKLHPPFRWHGVTWWGDADFCLGWTVALRRNCCFITLMMWCILHLSHTQGTICSRMMTDLYPFPVSLCVSVLPVTKWGSTHTTTLENCESKTKHSDWLSWARVQTENQQQQNGTRIWTSVDDSYCVAPVHKPSRVWDWQMSKLWPKMNALIITHIQMYEVTKLRDLKNRCFTLCEKVSCKEQMWIFWYDSDDVWL